MAVAEPSGFPQEIFCRKILSPYLELSQIARCREVCRQWRAMINEIPALQKFERAWPILGKTIKPAFSIALPPHLNLTASNVLPFENSWAIESLDKRCFLLPNTPLGNGRLFLLGSTLLRLTADHHFYVYTAYGDTKKLNVRVHHVEIEENLLLVLTKRRTAILHDSHMNVLFRVPNVAKAGIAAGKLLTYHPEDRTIRLYDIATKTVIFERRHIDRVNLTRNGELLYQIGPQLFCQEQPICNLGSQHLCRENDGIIFLEDEDKKTSALFLRDGIKNKIDIPVNPEECSIIKYVSNCTIFVAYSPNANTTTMVIDKKEFDPTTNSYCQARERAQLSNNWVPCFSDGFIWILGSHGLVYDVHNGCLISLFPGLTNDSSMFTDSFLSDNHLVCVQGNKLSLWLLDGTFTQ